MRSAVLLFFWSQCWQLCSLFFVPIDDSGPHSFCPVLSFNYHLFRLDGFLDIEQASSSSPVRTIASVHAVALELALAIGYVCVQPCFTDTNYIWFFIVYKNFKFIKLINNAPGVENAVLKRSTENASVNNIYSIYIICQFFAAAPPATSGTRWTSASCPDSIILLPLILQVFPSRLLSDSSLLSCRATLSILCSRCCFFVQSFPI